MPELGGMTAKAGPVHIAGETAAEVRPRIPRVLQELRSQGQDVGNDVHALLTTIQGYWVFISEEENSGR